MAKGDAKRERQRVHNNFRADIADLADLTPDEAEIAARYIETWWADGISGVRRLVNILAYFKLEGVEPIREEGVKPNDVY